jgi:AraC-like DNA-binding protein
MPLYLLFLFTIGAGWFLAANLILRGGRANRLYSMLLIVVMYEIFMQYMFGENGKALFPLLFTIRNAVFFSYGVLVFFYVSCLTGAAPEPVWKKALHFLPSLLVLAAGLLPGEAWPAPLTVGLYSLEAASGHDRQEPFYLLVLISASAYLALSIRAIARSAPETGAAAKAAGIRRRWLSGFLAYSYFVLASFAVSTFVYLRYSRYSELTSTAFRLVLSAPIYFSGYMVIVKGDVYEALHLPGTAGRDDAVPAESKYSKSRLPERVADDYLERIGRMIAAERVFRDPDLTLNSFAGQLGIAPSYVSQIISLRLNSSFSSLLNGARIEYAKGLLSDGGNGDTILEIAYESGFRSKTTFNTLFKGQVGLTPSEFRQRALSGRDRSAGLHSTPEAPEA